MTTPTNEAGHGLPELPLSMDTAPRDGTMVRLLVQFEDHATEDTDGPAWTIGACNDDNVSDDERVGWQFAGWCWSHDHFTEGRGTPVGWLPMIARDALALSRGVPADMVLVPREPTGDMLEAYQEAMCGLRNMTSVDDGELVILWNAMLAAAPAAAGAQGEDAKSFNAGWMEGHDKGWSSGYQRALYDSAGMPRDFDWNEAKAKAYEAYNNTAMPQQSVTAPQPAADGGVRERARELLAEALRQDGMPSVADSVMDPDDVHRVNRGSALRAIEAALSSHRQAGDVAVAQVRRGGKSAPHDALYVGLIPRGTATPEVKEGDLLYLAPPPGADLSKFRELAEEWKARAKEARQEAEEETSEVMYYANRHEAAAYSGCAYALLALVEKGAGNG